MNYWFEWDALVEKYNHRFGAFHMSDLTAYERSTFQPYCNAHWWIHAHRWDCDDYPVPRYISILMPKELVDLIHTRSITREQQEVMDTYTLAELKKRVIANYYRVSHIPYKPFKKNWAAAYIETKKWSFNTFATRSELNEDVLRLIKTFL